MSLHWATLLLVTTLTIAGCDALGSESSYASEATMVDFIDNTSTYQGKELTFKLNIGGSAGDSLRDSVGGFAWFNAWPKSAKLEMFIKVPITLNVPNAHRGDEVVVKFLCSKGKVDGGNVALSITRP